MRSEVIFVGADTSPHKYHVLESNYLVRRVSPSSDGTFFTEAGVVVIDADSIGRAKSRDFARLVRNASAETPIIFISKGDSVRATDVIAYSPQRLLNGSSSDQDLVAAIDDGLGNRIKSLDEISDELSSSSSTGIMEEILSKLKDTSDSLQRGLSEVERVRKGRYKFALFGYGGSSSE